MSDLDKYQWQEDTQFVDDGDAATATIDFDIGVAVICTECENILECVSQEWQEDSNRYMIKMKPHRCEWKEDQEEEP